LDRCCRCCRPSDSSFGCRADVVAAAASPAADRQAIADELNERPRKRFGYHTPDEELAKLVARKAESAATTPESADGWRP
jgi:hypothetical protein